MKRAYRTLAFLVLLALIATATAATGEAPESVRKQVEASMLLTGTIEIEADGSVRGYTSTMKTRCPARSRTWSPNR